ncbi:MAG: hypothetical protein A2017_15430 [Lentisphaerae bacterium GWF2_44_16]|nr:MAG: hypothetical protein A2017_15430 [Lentisphaerae bacterium GWF2_44_16]
MINNTVMRNEQFEKRISLRDAQETFINVVSEGTSCSRFDAQVISAKAQEIFRLGPYGDESAMQPGQMLWKAILASEPPGKPLTACEFKTIRLTVHRQDEDHEVKVKHGASAKRGQQIMRICEEAFEQGTLLTQEDLGTILDCDVRTIREDQKRYQKEHGILIPTRGNKCDIGPGITHREKTIMLFIEGKEALEIAAEMKHSLKAVERYISSYCRIVYCQQQLRNTLKTAMVVGVSVPLVNKCLEIHQSHCLKPVYKERLEEIERCGAIYWEAQDSKKKPGQTEGRKP